MLARCTWLAAVMLAIGCLREPLFQGGAAGAGGGADGGTDGGTGAGGGGAPPSHPFPPTEAALDLREPLPVDLDADGVLDLVVPSVADGAGRGVFVLFGEAGSRASRYTLQLELPAPAGPPLAVSVADLDADRTKDLLVLAGDGQRAHLLAYRGVAPVGFEAPAVKDVTAGLDAALPAPAERNGSIAVLQLDGQGAPEIVVAGQRNVFTFTFPGFAGTAYADAELLLVPGPVTGGAWDSVTRVAAAQEGESPARLLVSDRFLVATFEGGPLVTLAERRHDTAGSNWPLLVTAVVDLDGGGSGDRDLVGIAPSSSALTAVLPWPADRRAFWPGGCFIACDNTPDQLAVLDLDGSGRPEVILLDERASADPVLLQVVEDVYAADEDLRSNTPLVSRELPPGLRPAWLVPGDLDGDGRREIVALERSGRSTCLRWTPGALAPCD